MQHNLVFFMTDQQRADTIGMRVGEEWVTPALTALCKNAVQFTTAYDACPLCVPARTALATGIEPLKSKMFLNVLNSNNAPGLPTLHRMLYDNGYEIAHMGVNHIVVSPPLKNSLPFAAWECDETYEAYALQSKLMISREDCEVTMVDELCDGEYRKRPYSNAFVSECQYQTKDFKDIWFAQHAVDYIKQSHEKPFALFVCLWAPHPPLRVPGEYLKMFPESAVTLPENTMREACGQPASRRKGAPMQLAKGLAEQELKKAWSAHCALTRLCDDQLEKVLMALQEAELEDKTLFVFTTDHGEQLGQHAMYQKMEMYESAVRVPAVFKMPGAKPASLHNAISHLDFVPTILELLSLPAKKLDGNSLAKSILQGEEPEERDVFSVYCGNHALGDCRRMIVRGGYKYIYDGSAEELYHLSTDPLEMKNLAGEEAFAPLCAALQSALAEHFATTDFLKYRGSEK